MDIGKDLQRAFDDGYNKAIDEFVDKADSILGASDSDIYCKGIIMEIAEQMKGES